MNRIVFGLSALVFVQLINGQTTCQDAVSALPQMCISLLNNGDTSVCLREICRSILDEIDYVCETSVSVQL